MLVVRSLLVVHHGRAVVIERFGRFRRVAGPGWSFRLPVVEQVRASVDLREQVIVFPAVRLPTSDDQTVAATSQVFTRIDNVETATYGTSNWVVAVERLGLARLTDLVSDRTRAENLRSRRVTLEALRADLAAHATRWGILIVDVEVLFDVD